MALYTYKDNIDPRDRTSAIDFDRTDGSRVRFTKGTSLDLTDDEVGRLSKFIQLVAGGTPSTPVAQPAPVYTDPTTGKIPPSLLPALSGDVRFAWPWVAGEPINEGDLRVQAGQLYTAPGPFTAGATFNAASWTLGATRGLIVERNSGNQSVAHWRGEGLGIAATNFEGLLASGLFNPRELWSAGAPFATNDLVPRAGGGLYLAIAPSTGIDPAAEVDANGVGAHWYRLGAPGPKGDPGSASVDSAILSRHLADIVRPAESGWMIGAGFAQNGRRDDYGATAAMATRQVMSSGGLVLPGGRPVAGLRMICTTAITLPLHQFVILYNARTLARLAVGTDVTAQAMTVGLDVGFPIAYTPPAGIEVLAAYYCEVNATGVLPAFAAKSSTTAGTPMPRFGGLHDTLAAGSGPGAAPDPLTPASGGRGPFWVQAE